MLLLDVGRPADARLSARWCGRIVHGGTLGTVALHLMPGTVVECGEHWTIATNLNQNLIGRVIVVAARPVDSVAALSAGEWQDLHRKIGRTRAALDTLFHPDQYNYAFLMNQDAQVHLHVVPRYGQPRQWAGDTYDDPHFGSLFGPEQRILDAKRLTILADQVHQHLPDRNAPPA